MNKWEYKRNTNNLLSDINAESDNGWELVSVTPTGTYNAPLGEIMEFWYKREKEADNA